MREEGGDRQRVGVWVKEQSDLLVEVSEKNKRARTFTPCEVFKISPLNGHRT